MKKLLIRIVVVAVMLVGLNWIYAKWFYKDDMVKYSDVVELSWQVDEDSCRIIYLGESSNNHYGDEETNRRKISDFAADYFPNVRFEDLTKEGAHAEVYYWLLKNIPASSSVETVVVTMNLRSFGIPWIYSDMETPIQEYLVLMKDYPPLLNRFLLALKAYPIRTSDEWAALRKEHRRTDSLNFPYPFKWNNVHEWDSAMAWRGLRKADGTVDRELTPLACHFIKTYAFEITDDNPRVKDFDRIVELCHERGWNLVFNLMAENVDKTQELVGNDLTFLMKRNRDYLLNRYGTIDGVTVVDNLSLVRDVNFIDQDWTTEHYYEEGRRIVAHHLVQTLKEFYPDDYRDPDSLYYDLGHYYNGDQTCRVDSAQPYGPCFTLPGRFIFPEWEKVNVAFRMRQGDTLNDAHLVVDATLLGGKGIYHSYPVKSQMQDVDVWDYFTQTIAFDSLFYVDNVFALSQLKIYVHNPSASAVEVSGLDVSFRPSYLKPRIKAQLSTPRLQ